jgi:hypothetical protein
VVNWGTACDNNFPSVYTNVTYYQKWINDTISRAEVLGANHLDSFDFLFLMILLLLALLGPSCAFGTEHCTWRVGSVAGAAGGRGQGGKGKKNESPRADDSVKPLRLLDDFVT